MEIENFLIATIGFGCWNSRRAHSVHEFLLFLGLIVTKHTKSGKKKFAPTILNYIFVCNNKKKKSIWGVWGAGMERYWKQSYFLGLGMSSWNSNKLEWTLLKMASGLSPNVEKSMSCWGETGAQLRTSRALPHRYLCSKSLTLSTVSETLGVFPGEP